MSDFPGFDEFYTAVHGRAPFPWQCRLADLVLASGWPSDIGVPTGLGKTSAIDVALWTLAAQSATGDVRVPRRIWYVVDRRLLVDAASDHAQRLADLMVAADAPLPVRTVAEALGSLTATGGGALPPVFVSRLRGGGSLAHTASRPPDPAQPAVICSTVDMFGSRLLFRGYGSSRSMWPIDAALAGMDSLVLLDEAHLAQPLQKLLTDLAACDANDTGVFRLFGRFTSSTGPDGLLPAPRSRPILVNLTATGATHAFDLDAADRANPVVQARLSAAKPTRLVSAPKKGLPRTLASEVLTEVGPRPTCAAVVFVNSPQIAREVAAAINQSEPGITPVVLTGQLRDPDAAAVREVLLDAVRGCASGGHPDRDAALVVIATQTLEVGADLDFDVCVSQSAGARAIIQRWGRLNRLGNNDDAVGIIVHEEESDGGLYGAEAEAVFARLQAHGAELDLAPELISELVGPARDVPGRSGEILPAHLWEFAKTSVPPPGAAPPEVFFDTLDAPDRRVSLLWRAVVPEPGQGLIPPVRQGELVDVPIGQARSFLEERAGDRHAVASGPTVCVIGDDGDTLDMIQLSRLQPGMRVVLPVAAGGYGPSGWNPEAVAEVMDLSPHLGQMLRLSEPAVANAFREPVLIRDVLSWVRELEFSVEEGPDPVRDQEVADELGLLLVNSVDWLAGCRGFTVARFGPDEDPVLAWRCDSITKELPIDALDELSNAPSARLDEHLCSVGELAERIGIAVGLPPEMCAVLRDAGRFHDLGKADARFQRWLGGDVAEPLAKSAMPPGKWRRAAIASGWPFGARHELLSVQILDEHVRSSGPMPEFDLVRHLVLTHHGHGRPFCPTSMSGAETTRVRVDGVVVEAVTDPGDGDWSQPERFRLLTERFGYWGLALMEAALRQADHRVSAATEVL
jgi:CRISPR-associated endonuclease/helicase Cas3